MPPSLAIGETLRYDERFDSIEHWLDRIEKRLGLIDNGLKEKV
jgi:hypothetical protein